MSEYQAPLEDITFLLEHVVGLSEIAKLPGCEDAQPDFVAALLEEAAKFMGEVLSPLNRVGDLEGSRIEGDRVVTPSGFREAYAKFTEAGWGGVGLPSEYGGAGLPQTVAIAVQEMNVSANMAFGLCPSLGEGAIAALYDHGSEDLKQIYLSKLVPGEWTATMCLTEPQAGSDLAAVRVMAKPMGDGTYRIKGTKVFITWGDHDMADNVVHLVLARTPDAPPGVRGISCFIVPKFLVGPDCAIGARNEVDVVSLEHKLGIHGSPTCLLNFGEGEGAIGYLIGEENRGLEYMFTMMNHERILAGCQGLAIAERAYQRAVEYAREREQGRAFGSDRPKGESSPIIEHADVRRMLLTMKSTIEAMRCLLYTASKASDLAEKHPDADVRARNEARLALLTPIAKLWLSESATEVASLAIQIHGGMGVIEESGVAQHYRDARVISIWEGTSGIQALDLVRRKLPLEGGAVVREYLDELHALDDELAAAGESFAILRENFAAGVRALSEATEWLLERSERDPSSVIAAATPYARMFSEVAGASCLARSALVAKRLLDAGSDDASLSNRLVTARFFSEQILPGAVARMSAITAGADVLFAIDADGF
ncbi:MAG: acyl-CoA dehydrogenase [Deltaproteobacteria bacterium]|nr:acyl-CoA dehydrogenase [Deltaproteobacteria bacterium]